MISRKKVVLSALAATIALAAAVVGAWQYAEIEGILPLARHDGAIWLTVRRTSPLLSHAMRLALAGNQPAVPGKLAWRTIDQGFEVADLPVLFQGQEVDHLQLARIASDRFRFVARNAVSGSRDLDHWLASSGAALIVNGSFFSRSSEPATPLLSEGALLGPARYDAKAGAFVASASFTGVRDLAREDWKAAFQGATNAMVSYPLLVAGGVSRVPHPSEWLATRSFIGQDSSGRIVIGTTTDAFFSLARLARFLLDAPLDLTIALNLDGGPVACQGIVLNGYRRTSYGDGEAQVDGDKVALLLRRPHAAATMPIVLAVFPK